MGRRFGLRHWDDKKLSKVISQGTLIFPHVSSPAGKSCHNQCSLSPPHHDRSPLPRGYDERKYHFWENLVEILIYTTAHCSATATSPFVVDRMRFHPGKLGGSKEMLRTLGCSLDFQNAQQFWRHWTQASVSPFTYAPLISPACSAVLFCSTGLLYRETGKLLTTDACLCIEKV